MDFIYLFRILMKRKWIILGAAFIAALIAFLFTKDDKKLYSSTTQISTGFTVGDEIKVNNENFDFYAADTKFSNAIVTLTSPTVISLVSYSLILHDLESPKPFHELTDAQKKSPLYFEVNKEEAKRVFADKLETMSVLTSYRPDEKKLLEYLKLYDYDFTSIINYLNVYRVGQTDYIQIDYRSENPELSAFVVNTAFDQFMRYYKTIRSERSSESIDTLKSILDKKKEILDQKNAALQSAGLVNGDIEAKSNLDRIKELEGKLADEQSKQTMATFTLQQINKRLANSGNSSNATTNNNNSATDNDELVALRKQRDDALSAYVSTGSTDQNLLKKYNQAKAQYNNKLKTSGNVKNVTPITSTNNTEELQNKKSDAQAELDASTANISTLQSQINALKGNVTSDAQKSTASQTLLNDATQADKDYQAAKQNYNDALDKNFSSVNNFRQILTGQPALEPLPSKRLMIIGMAGMSALVISILIIVFLAYLDSSVKTPAIFSKTVNLKLISMVNFMNLKDKKLADIVTSKSYKTGKSDDNRHNVFRESLRKLRYEIESSGKKIFLFTSTKKGEGKTTLIQALSYSMSLSKKKILIIDTNFCNNDLTVQLNGTSSLDKIDIDNTPGTFLEDVKNSAIDVGAGTVYVIGCESGDYTPSEMLPRENLLQRLHLLTPVYDYIFLEGPPLNDFSDSKELASYVDGVIAVFSANRNIKQIDKQSIEFFKSLNGKFTGSILNKVQLENVNVS
ncbi:MAG: GumC family protein [Chitinophagaceae bacterium]